MKAVGQRKRKVLIIIFSIVISIILILQSGMVYVHNKVQWQPNYAKTDITKIIYKENITKEEYNIIFSQTGLSETAVKDLLLYKDFEKILEIQDAFFAPQETYHEVFAPFTCSDRLYKDIPLCNIEDGDIIISPSSHFSYLKSGHAAIVVNAAEGRILNATGYGFTSSVEDITELSCRPGFAVLRLKADRRKRAEIAKYALENLYDINYSLTAGIFRGNSKNELKTTHCGHLVWYAFKEFGYDIDSNKGLVVWPKDISKSDILETVQIYGINPENFWE